MKERQQMIKMIYGYYFTQSLNVASKLDLSDIIGDDELKIEEIAKLSKTNASSLYRMMRVLAGEGVFEETTKKKFKNTSLSSLLKKSHPQSLNGLSQLHGDELWWNSWGELEYSVRNNKPGTDHHFGMGAFELMASKPNISKIFNNAMANLAKEDADSICKLFDFSKFNSIIDIAGGTGTLIDSIKNNFPNKELALFDQPHVIEGINHQNYKLHAGDFFKSVPSGFDLYILRHIIHDWSDEQSIAILKNCTNAMGKDSKIIIIEMLLQEGNNPSIAKYRDLTMLVTMRGGKERYIEEFKNLFNSAGLKFLSTVQLPSSMNMIIGEKL